MPSVVQGTDYNPLLVDWCRRNLKFAEFRTNTFEPPLHNDDGEFGLVYAFSVFSHLPEQLLRRWMEEFWRVLTDGGYLLISTHGAAYLNCLGDDEQQAFHGGKLVTRHVEDSGTNRCGVYFSESYVRNVLAKGFLIVDYLPQGAAGNPPQDLVLLRKTNLG